MTAPDDTEKHLSRLAEDVARYRRESAAHQLVVKDFKATTLRTLAYFTSALCLLSVIMPFWEIELDDEDAEPYNILSSAFNTLGYRNEDGGTDGVSIFFGIAFLVLVAVIIAVVVLLLRIAADGDFLPSGALKKTTCVLLGLGVLGAWATSTFADEWSWQPALPLMTLAAILAIPLLSCSTTNA